MERETPYDFNERRIGNYIQYATENELGCGIDPTGFIIASHGALVEKNKQNIKRVADLEAALRDLIAACDAGTQRFVNGVCGMTIDAMIRNTVINGVRLIAVEDARDTLHNYGEHK